MVPKEPEELPPRDPYLPPGAGSDGKSDAPPSLHLNNRWKKAINETLDHVRENHKDAWTTLLESPELTERLKGVRNLWDHKIRHQSPININSSARSPIRSSAASLEKSKSSEKQEFATDKHPAPPLKSPAHSPIRSSAASLEKSKSTERQEFAADEHPAPPLILSRRPSPQQSPQRKPADAMPTSLPSATTYIASPHLSPIPSKEHVDFSLALIFLDIGVCLANINAPRLQYFETRCPPKIPRYRLIHRTEHQYDCHHLWMIAARRKRGSFSNLQISRS